MTTVPSTPYTSSYIPSPPSSLQSYKSTSPSSNHNHHQHHHHHHAQPVQIFDLQDVLLQYQSQPELLKLILSSKVEEDKRRTEEAKLRAKELDLELRKDRSTTTNVSHKRNNSLSSHSSNSSISSNGSSHLSNNHHYHHSSSHHHHYSHHLPYPHTTSSHHHHQHQQQKRAQLRAITAPYPSPHGREMVDEQQERRNSAAVAMVAMGTSRSSSSSPPPSYFPASPSISSASHSPVTPNAYPSPTVEYCSSPPSNNSIKQEKGGSDHATSPVTSPISAPNPITTCSGRARRKREMQAITKIVETREFPYQDSYFWKNNGNTTQRKTGCKSIYYKCSNSNKGCPVNKTVTERPNGEYIIKYRGQHLLECGRVERIVDL